MNCFFQGLDVDVDVDVDGGNRGRGKLHMQNGDQSVSKGTSHF